MAPSQPSAEEVAAQLMLAPFTPMVSPTVDDLITRWATDVNRMPDAGKIFRIEFFDFDGTLFRSPLPNPSLWTQKSIKSVLPRDKGFLHGGWWHDPRFLRATGAGFSEEEDRAWDGFWFEDVVARARTAIANPNIFTVLSTGRLSGRYDDTILRIIRSKGLAFDMVVLKPKRAADTASYKKALLRDLLDTFWDTRYLHVYEDRMHHVKKFDALLNVLQSLDPRFLFNVEHVNEGAVDTILSPKVEEDLVLTACREVNGIQKLRPRSVRSYWVFVSVPWGKADYIIADKDSQRLLDNLGVTSGDGHPAGLAVSADHVVVRSDAPAPRWSAYKEGVGAGWVATATVFREGVWIALVYGLGTETDKIGIVVLGSEPGCRPDDDALAGLADDVTRDKAVAWTPCGNVEFGTMVRQDTRFELVERSDLQATTRFELGQLVGLDIPLPDASSKPALKKRCLAEAVNQRPDRPLPPGGEAHGGDSLDRRQAQPSRPAKRRRGVSPGEKGNAPLTKKRRR